MPDMLGTGLSGLRAMQRALDTTAHNIANVSTDGYSRQRVDFGTRNPQSFGGNWVGSGVDATAVRRVYDQYISQQARSSGGNLARLDAFATQAERLDNLLGDSSNGLGAALQSFTDAINEVSSTPSSVPARQVLLSEAQAFVERLQNYDERLRTMDADFNTRISGEARDITQLAKDIAKLNESISAAMAGTGKPPNDLLDKRDVLIDQLSSKIGVTVVAEGDATLNIFVGNGQPLVLGGSASQITTAPDAIDPERLTLALQTPSGTVDLSRSVSGGIVGGLLDYRREMLDPARNDLGRITLAAVNQVNAQHRAGMDLNGNLGGDLFTVGGVSVTDSLANTGTATLSVTRTSVGALTSSDYVLLNTGSGYTLRNKDTGAAVAFTGTGTALDPIQFDGLSLVVGAGSAGGDQYVIHPTRDAISGLGVLISDPARVAAAAPIRAAAATANTGTGRITAGQVTNAADPDLLATVNIVFTSATTYSIDGGPDIAYAAGSDIDVNGWRVQISGAPASGDSFTVRNNAGAVGDNRNAFALADALEAGVLDNGATSVAAAAERLMSDVGLSTRSAQMSRDAAQAVNESDLAARDAISGVNLDEEAANMLRFQQAYQANAQIIAIAGQMFDALINAVRR
jgi:flagellar hook-associated protein 1 FlgK